MLRFTSASQLCPWLLPGVLLATCPSTQSSIIDVLVSSRRYQGTASVEAAGDDGMHRQHVITVNGIVLPTLSSLSNNSLKTVSSSSLALDAVIPHCSKAGSPFETESLLVTVAVLCALTGAFVTCFSCDAREIFADSNFSSTSTTTTTTTTTTTAFSSTASLVTATTSKSIFGIISAYLNTQPHSLGEKAIGQYYKNQPALTALEQTSVVILAGKKSVISRFLDGNNFVACGNSFVEDNNSYEDGRVSSSSVDSCAVSVQYPTDYGKVRSFVSESFTCDAHATLRVAGVYVYVPCCCCCCC